MSVYDFTASRLDGEDAPLSDYRGQVLLIVNTASAMRLHPAICRAGGAVRKAAAAKA